MKLIDELNDFRDKFLWERFKIAVKGERGSFNCGGYDELSAKIELLDVLIARHKPRKVKEVKTNETNN